MVVCHHLAPGCYRGNHEVVTLFLGQPFRKIFYEFRKVNIHGGIPFVEAVGHIVAFDKPRLMSLYKSTMDFGGVPLA